MTVDLSSCPYYRQDGSQGNHGPNTCLFSCYGEPACITQEPEGGWTEESLRPMAEAPHDGTHITVTTEDDEFGAWWDKVSQGWRDEEGLLLGRDEQPWGWRS